MVARPEGYSGERCRARSDLDTAADFRRRFRRQGSHLRCDGTPRPSPVSRPNSPASTFAWLKRRQVHRRQRLWRRRRARTAMTTTSNGLAFSCSL
jgi:hypothetical protein